MTIKNKDRDSNLPSEEGKDPDSEDCVLDEEESHLEASLQEDAIFQNIEEQLSQGSHFMGSCSTLLSEASSTDYNAHLSENYTCVPYGFQPKATYTHAKKNTDIMGVTYNGRTRQFILLDTKGATVWSKDALENQVSVERPMQYPKYEYRLITSLVYAKKYNVYFALGKDFGLKVLNREFQEICHVRSDLSSILFMIFNPVRDELITGGVGGARIWSYKQVAGKMWTEIKHMANYRLVLKEELKDVGGAWVKRVDLDLQQQHLYCCSDMDLYAYNMDGKLIFKFQRAHSMSITGCVYSPQARLMVTASVDTEVKVWSITGGLVHTFRGHTRAVSAVVLHPDTSMLILTSSLDGTVRLWSLHSMDCLYSISVSSIGILWMGFTDDGFLYLGTLRHLSLWSLNQVAVFWATTRNKLKQLTLTEGENKSTRLLAVGEDSSIRIFSRRTKKNLSTVLPPPSLSPMQQAQWVTYNRLYSVAYVLINTREIYVYTTRTDPACRIAVWDVLNIQHDLLQSQGTDTKNTNSKYKPGFMNKGPVHRASLHGEGTEGVSECLCLCYLNSTTMVWTDDEGLACPTQHVYLLFGLSDGRILFMDPVVKGKKYMEFKVNKDSIVDMKHNTTYNTLTTMCDLGDAFHIQVWSLPHLSLMHQVFTTHDLTDYIRLNSTLLTIHRTGVVQCHELLSTEDNPAMMNVRPRFSLSDETSSTLTFDPIKADHEGPVLSIDVCPNLGIFCTCSGDGVIKIWQEQKVLLTEIHLEESLCSACFLNNSGDLLVGFKNHLFLISAKKVCPSLTNLGEEEVDWETDSEIYEDPAVKYEGVHENPDPVDLESYLVPFDIDFSKDFLEGKKPLIPVTDADLENEDEQSELSWAPTDTYLSPGQSPRRLSLIDLTLSADPTKHDLRKHMTAVLQGKPRVLSPSVRFQGAEQEPREEEEDVDKEMLTFEFPRFGLSPGPTPSPSTPSVMTPSSFDVSEGGESTEEEVEETPEGFTPIEKPKKTSKPKKVAKPEPVKVDRSSEVEERIRISVKDRLDAIKVDSKSIIKEEAKKQAKDGKAKDVEKSEEMKLLDQLELPPKGREIKKKEAKADRRRPKADERRLRQELSQEDRLEGTEPETAIGVFVEDETDPASGESTPKDKPAHRKKRPTKVTRKVKDEEDTNVKGEEKKTKTAEERAAPPPLPTTSIINMTPGEADLKNKLSVPSSERRRVGQRNKRMIDVPAEEKQQAEAAPSGDEGAEETESGPYVDHSDTEQYYEGSVTGASGRQSTEVGELALDEDIPDGETASGLVERPLSSHHSVTSGNLTDYTAHTGDTTQRSLAESLATSHMTSSSTNDMLAVPDVTIKVKGSISGVVNNETADDLMDDLEDAGAMATRSEREPAESVKRPLATKSILRVKSAASSSRSPSVKFGLKDTGDDGGEGCDLDLESQVQSVARVDSPTSQSEYEPSEAPSAHRMLHDITLPGYDIPEHGSSYPRSGSPTIYSDYGSEWTVPYSEDLMQDELGEHQVYRSHGGVMRAHTAKARPNTPSEGLPRPQTRPHTAHGIPLDRQELEVMFAESLRKYQGLPGTTEYIPNIHQKSANKFGSDYHDKFLERHHLLKMQRELRVQSATEKRQLLQKRKRERQTGLHGHHECDKGTHSTPSKTDTMLLLLNQILTSDTTLPMSSSSEVKVKSPGSHPSIPPKSRAASARPATSQHRTRAGEPRPHSHTVSRSHQAPLTSSLTSSQPLSPGYSPHTEGANTKTKSLTFARSPRGRDTCPSVASHRGEGRTPGEGRCQSADSGRESRPPSAVIKSELGGELPFRFSIQIKPKSLMRDESPDGVSVSSTPAPTSVRNRPKSSQSVPVVTIQSKVKMRDDRTTEPYPILRKSKQPVMTEKDVRQMDPREPTAFMYRAAPSKSIPNKCSQYILVNNSRRKSAGDILASPLEEQLILNRFPAWQDKWLGQNHKFVTLQPKPFDKVRYSPQTAS